jgi:hypothetical protein
MRLCAHHDASEFEGAIASGLIDTLRPRHYSKESEMKKADALKCVFSKGLLKAAVVVFAAFAMATAFTSVAKADCGASMPAQKSSSNAAGNGFVLAAFHPAAANRAGNGYGDDDRDSDGPSIVGLWNIQMTSLGNAGIKDGSVLDFGYVAWHADGTEIMNSGTHAPITSNFCMGVYKKTGRLSYHLNHFAMPWTADGTAWAGTVNIKEDVTLEEKGDFYSGSFTLTVYNPAGQQVAQLKGRITATRVLPD